MIDSTTYLNDYKTLKKRLDTYGYLLIRNFFSVNDASFIFTEINKALLTKKKIDPKEDPRINSNYSKAYSLECVHNCWHAEPIKSFFQNIFQKESFLHPRVVLRNCYKNEYTPAHQDWPQVQGSKNTLGVWVALSNIKKGGGLLEIAEKSHKLGVYKHYPDKKYGGMKVKDNNFKWISTDMKPGDAIVFSCLTVHRTEKNKFNIVRQSIDARWQPLSERICKDSLTPLIKKNWSDIYKNWNNKSNTWYWKKSVLIKDGFDTYYEINNAMNIMNYYKRNKSWRLAIEKIIARTSSPILRSICEELIKK